MKAQKVQSITSTQSLRARMKLMNLQDATDLINDLKSDLDPVSLRDN